MPTVISTVKNNSASLRGPCFSPDGSLIAFGNIRSGNRNSYLGVYEVPFFGGPITRVTEVMVSKNAGGYLTVNNWNTP
jgi:hypothetical protein